MNNLIITDSPELLDDYALIDIDAKKCRSLREFYETLAEKLHFPDYFGFNMDSFDEMMNDLSWIEDERILLYFKNSAEFLINERNDDKVNTLLDLLDATCEDWKWMEDEVEEEDATDLPPKKELIISFAPSERMTAFLADFQ